MALAILGPAATGSSAEGDAGESDVALVARFARSGDQEAFAALVRRHGPSVLGVCRRILRDGHAAEDAFQTVFMVLAARAAEVARPEALGAWLYGVALRVALKVRSSREPIPAGESVEVAVTTDPTAELAAVELRLLLDQELAKLPDAERDLLVLVYLEGKTHDEAARSVGCPVGSVAWRLDRARESLRKRLARRGVILSVGFLLLLAAAGRAGAVEEALVRRVSSVARPRPAPTTARRPAWPRIAAVLFSLLLITGCALGAWAALGSTGPAERDPAVSAPNRPDTTALPAEPRCNNCKIGGG